jgi:hypothetical protein
MPIPVRGRWLPIKGPKGLWAREVLVFIFAKWAAKLI